MLLVLERKPWRWFWLISCPFRILFVVVSNNVFVKLQANRCIRVFRTRLILELRQQNVTITYRVREFEIFLKISFKGLDALL